LWAEIEAFNFIVTSGNVNLSAGARVAPALVALDIGQVNLSAKAKSEAINVVSETNKVVGNVDLSAKAQVFGMSPSVGVGTVSIPAAAKHTPFAFGVDLSQRNFTLGAKVEATAPAVGIGNRDFSLGAKVAGLSFIADLGVRNFSAGAKSAPVATPTAGRRYTDLMNRTNASTLGANYGTTWNGSNQIASNAAQAKNAANGNGRAAAWNQYTGAEFSDSGKLYTDNYRAKIQLKAPTTGVATDNFTIVGFGHSTFGQAGINKCYLLVSTASGSAIVTQSGAMGAPGIGSGTAGQTIRASGVVSVASTDLIEFERVGNIWSAYKNSSGTSFLSWNDSGALVPTGSSFRNCVIAIECNYPAFTAQFSAPGIDSLEFWDL
jgi:hypothetical protein